MARESIHGADHAGEVRELSMRREAWGFGVHRRLFDTLNV
ncbi:hypothetical protein PCL1606_35710 [Pseudomonas chlororaphis]|uniref:Uncharacterized protein n=1 Tax=Pseudomonas chlororaphis TaxID=587753 RepID=A0A0D5Y204_9PSED|nr:hypothetical protein PCL1606_35710 [Pseudomonas chlororaphis]